MAKEPTNICACYSVVDSNGVHTSCGRLVKGRFAPGHDAKLKGALIRAAVAGESFKIQDKDSKVVTKDPGEFASELGWGKYIDQALVTAKTKADKATARAEAKAKAAADKPAKAAKATTNRVAPKEKVDRNELAARKAAQAAGKASGTKKADKAASLV